MIRSGISSVTLLIVLATASAVGVVSAQHKARRLHSASENEKNYSQSLEVEWGRLQLEQSTLVAHRRVESIARERLGMVFPNAGQIIALEEDWP
ncbi:MAG: cell division protein FtsL [Azoarcus sp.]|jgi:cell division protein FtsL|nr:cell division protein FtsL [Azoarcus sp.]